MLLRGKVSQTYGQLQASAGLIADGRHLVKRARDEAQAWRDIYRQPIPGKVADFKIVVCGYYSILIQFAFKDYSRPSRSIRFRIHIILQCTSLWLQRYSRRCDRRRTFTLHD